MVNAMKLSILSNNAILYYDLKTVFCHVVVRHVKEHLFIYDFSLRGFILIVSIVYAHIAVAYTYNLSQRVINSRK